MGIDRDSLDAPLNELRLAGLVRIAGWESGQGQCYVVTDAGRSILGDPQSLAHLKSGKALSPIKTPAAIQRTNQGTTWDRGEAVRSAFLANRPAPIVYALAVSQVLVFVAGIYVVLRQEGQLTQYFANGTFGNPPRPPFTAAYLWLPAVEAGKWWQLLSTAFVHFGALHLLMNVYFLASLGPIVERMFGSGRFLVLYLLSALGGSVAALLLSPINSLTGGSSGALCGLVGGFAAFVLLNRRHLGDQIYDHSRRWLINTIFMLVLISFLPQIRISWQGHLGGFVAGAAAGVLLTYQRFGTTEQRWAALLGLIILPVAMLAPLVERGILHLPRHDQGVAERRIDTSVVTKTNDRPVHPETRTSSKLARQFERESV